MRNSKTILTTCGYLAAALFSGGPTFARTSSSTEESTQEKITFHEKMADIHTKMAECLRSGKPSTDCGKELRASLRKLMSEHHRMDDEMGCPMMERHGGQRQR